MWPEEEVEILGEHFTFYSMTRQELLCVRWPFTVIGKFTLVVLKDSSTTMGFLSFVAPR